MDKKMWEVIEGYIKRHLAWRFERMEKRSIGESAS